MTENEASEVYAYCRQQGCDRAYSLHVLAVPKDREETLAEIKRSMEKEAAFAASMEKRRQEIRTHGLPNKVLCFGCGIKYPSRQKDPRVCPSCGHDNDAS
jgi:hypothetical protein